MRIRHEKLSSSIALYEGKLADQADELQRYSQHRPELEEEIAAAKVLAPVDQQPKPFLSLEEEEEELRQLEQKKRGLEDRVTGLERDLGGLRG